VAFGAANKRAVGVGPDSRARGHVERTRTARTDPRGAEACQIYIRRLIKLAPVKTVEITADHNFGEPQVGNLRVLRKI
jgi:hypothetical protein